MFNKEVRLRVQASEDSVAIMVGVDNPDEEDALQAMEHIAQALGDSVNRYTRNTAKGDRIDMVVIRR